MYISVAYFAYQVLLYDQNSMPTFQLYAMKCMYIMKTRLDIQRNTCPQAFVIISGLGPQNKTLWIITTADGCCRVRLLLHPKFTHKLHLRLQHILHIYSSVEATATN